MSLINRIIFNLAVISTVTFIPLYTIAEWVDSDGSGLESINIYNVAGTTDTYPSIAIDSEGNPHVAFGWGVDAFSNIEINYLQRNGVSWTDADGSGKESIDISNNSFGNSSAPSIAIRNGNLPAIVWAGYHDYPPAGASADDSYEIRYLQWNGSAWVDADGTGTESSIIYESKTLAYPSVAPELVFDSDGKPQIVWQEKTATDYEIYFLKWNGSAWVDADGTGIESANISQQASNDYDPQIALDNSSRPIVVWHHKTVSNDEEIYLLKWNGSTWVDIDGVGQESINISGNSGRSLYADIDIDINNNPVVVWHDNTDVGGDFEIYLLKWNGSTWVDADGIGQESINVSQTPSTYISAMPKIKIDDSDNIHLTWQDEYDPTSYDTIKYLKWNGSAWVDADGSGRESETIYSQSGQSRTPEIDINRLSGNPMIIWTEGDMNGERFPYLLMWFDPIPTGSVNLLPETGRKL